MPKATRADEPLTIDVVIEIPRGSRNKFEWDEARRVIRLDRRIPGAVSYPTHYGFVPGTLASDGDPVDVLVFAEEPVYPGVWLTARPIGVGWVEDSGVLEPKIVCVPQTDPGASAICKLADLPPLVLKEIEQFFDVYKILEPDRHTRFARWGGRKDAAAAIEEARRAEKSRSNATGSHAETDDGRNKEANDFADVHRLVARLCDLHQTIAVAESCTGGLLAASIAGTDGAGDCFRGAIVAYSVQVKYDVLGVTPGRGVINAAAARQMAIGARRLMRADVGVATTGVVGPDREEDQPVGTIWIGVSSENEPGSAHRVDIDGAPDCVRERALHEAIRVAAEHLS